MDRTHKIHDKEYWERYYLERQEPFEPSRFARHVADQFVKSGDSLIELGCGNGRDAIYFAERGARVLAVDQCEREIGYLSRAHAHDNLDFVAGDFTELDSAQRFTHVYSRFTIHSISVEGQEAVLRWTGKVLDSGGHFLLEFRGKENELFGKGDVVPGDPDAFIHDGHYRRFLDLEQTCREVEGEGLEVMEAVEQKGFSPFNGIDETFARILARKRG